MEKKKKMNCKECGIETESKQGKQCCEGCAKKRRKRRQKEYHKAYHQKPEAIKKRRINHNKYTKEKRKEDKQYLLKCRLRRSVCDALRIYTTTGKIMTSKKYGINYKAIIKYLSPFPKNINKYHIDHIIPLSKFDLNNLEQVKRAFAPENLQWLTIQENLEKKDRLVMPHYNHKFDENGEEI